MTTSCAAERSEALRPERGVEAAALDAARTELGCGLLRGALVAVVELQRRVVSLLGLEADDGRALVRDVVAVLLVVT